MGSRKVSMYNTRVKNPTEVVSSWYLLKRIDCFFFFKYKKKLSKTTKKKYHKMSSNLMPRKQFNKEFYQAPS